MAAGGKGQNPLVWAAGGGFLAWLLFHCKPGQAGGQPTISQQGGPGTAPIISLPPGFVPPGFGPPAGPPILSAPPQGFTAPPTTGVTFRPVPAPGFGNTTR
jgi:hypothetical protein